MATRCGAAVLLSLIVSTLSSAQDSSFGPRPIYLRGSALAWDLSFDAPVEDVFDAARRAGKKNGLTVSRRDGEAGVLRQARTNLRGAVLDELCRYPIVSYYSWRRIENFASAQSAALGQRVRGESLAQAGRLNGTVHISIRQAGAGRYSVRSICSAHLRQWGVVEATSRGVVEKGFLESLLAGLGTPMEAPLPEASTVEPSRANPTRDLHVADLCQKRCVAGYQCAGMYVDLSTGELRCVDETIRGDTNE